MIKKLVQTIFAAFGISVCFAGTAAAQCSGQGTSGMVCAVVPASPLPDLVTGSAFLDAAISSARGTVLYRGAAGWSGLAAGTAGAPLISGGPGADPAWGSRMILGSGTYSPTTNYFGGTAAGVFEINVWGSSGAPINSPEAVAIFQKHSIYPGWNTVGATGIGASPNATLYTSFIKYVGGTTLSNGTGDQGTAGQPIQARGAALFSEAMDLVGGANTFIEGARIHANIRALASGAQPPGVADGAVIAASTKSGIDYIFLVSVEAAAYPNCCGDAPPFMNPSPAKFVTDFLATYDSPLKGDAAFAINPFNAGTWQVGYLVAGKIGQAGIRMETTMPTGIDMSSAHLTFGIIMPNSVPLAFANAANTAAINVMYLNTNDDLILGQDLAPFRTIWLQTTISPETDNNIDLGATNLRFRSMFAHSFFANTAFILSNNIPLQSTDTAGTGFYNLLYMNPSNELVLGASVGQIWLSKNTTPTATNLNFGTASLRWSTIFANIVNATTATFANNSPVRFTNAAGSAGLNMMYASAANDLVIGTDAAANVYFAKQPVPQVNNTTTLGAPTFRWSTVYAFNLSTSGVLVANLPTCNAAFEGTFASVINNNGTTFHAAAVSGGTDHISVRCDGTTWRVGG